MAKTIERSARACATLIERATFGPSPRVFGLDAHERLRRSFEGRGIDLVAVDQVADLGAERVVALQTSHFYDERLIAALLEDARDVLLLSGDAAASPVAVAGAAHRIVPVIEAMHRGEAPLDRARSAGIEILSPTGLVPGYDTKLRKPSSPYVLRADPERLGEIHDRIFDASYKGATDFVTKWVWPVPAQFVTRWCAGHGISPNHVTLLSYVLALLTGFEFWEGDFGTGLVCAWLMTFLDTVDGKLARVTLKTSRIGDVLDHGLDMIHPPIWWAAWGAGLAGPGVLFGAYDVWVAIVFAGYVVGRLLEGVFILAFGQEMFTWRPFDLAFRLVIARRNPNLVLLTGATIAGRPDLGLIAVGLWTLCCIAVQLVRIAQAAFHRVRGREISHHSG
ncbi:CDP-alcohol phosphatidyltransferase family protein [Myxococcota bacterium]|nr:CDP-alcohol phosphatidyltransferase family protein [Myxococcota bacterium]